MDKVLVTKSYLENVQSALSGDEYAVRSVRSGTRAYLEKPTDKITILKIMLFFIKKLIEEESKSKKAPKQWIYKEDRA